MNCQIGIHKNSALLASSTRRSQDLSAAQILCPEKAQVFTFFVSLNLGQEPGIIYLILAGKQSIRRCIVTLIDAGS